MKKIKARKKASKSQANRLLEAQKDLERIQKEIEPFVKKRSLRTQSTQGKWCDLTRLAVDKADIDRICHTS